MSNTITEVADKTFDYVIAGGGVRVLYKLLAHCP